MTRSECGEKPDLLILNSDVLERTQIETGPTNGEVSVYFIFKSVYLLILNSDVLERTHINWTY